MPDLCSNPGERLAFLTDCCEMTVCGGRLTPDQRDLRQTKETYAGPKRLMPDQTRTTVLICFLAHKSGGVGGIGAGDVPTDEHQVIGAVGFFKDDHDRDGATDAALVTEAQVLEIGRLAVGLICSEGPDCTRGCNADCASAEEFYCKFAGVPITLVAVCHFCCRVAERWFFRNPEGPVEPVIGRIVDA